MGEQNGKVFSTSWSAKLIMLIFVLAFLLLAYQLSFLRGSLFGLPMQKIFAVGMGALIFRVLFINFSEKLTISSSCIVRETIFGLRKQTILFSTIRSAKKFIYKSVSTISIETYKAKFSIGQYFSDEQIDEALAYLYKQLEHNYPENYESVKIEHYKVEQFWRK